MIELFFPPKPQETKQVSYVHRIKDDPLDLEELELFRRQNHQDYFAVHTSGDNPNTYAER